MPTGSLLLAFSDGLPNAHNPEGVAFSTNRIEEILHEHASYHWSADGLVDRLRQSQGGDMDGAEQFEDLTLLVLRAS